MLTGTGASKGLSWIDIQTLLWYINGSAVAVKGEGGDVPEPR